MKRRNLSRKPYELSDHLELREGTEMNETNYTPVLADRKQEAYRIAMSLHDQSPDWVTFFREILGIGGVVRRLFPEDKSLLEFEETPEHAEIQLMLARLRRKTGRGATHEPTRVITVRLPKSLHEALQAEAHLHQTSMNKLCISKLLQVLFDNEKPTGGPAVPAQVMSIPRVPVPSRAIPPVPKPSVPVNPVPKPAAPSFRSTYTPDNRY